MSQFNITVEGGTSVRLPTAGKYCDRDILVTGTGTTGGSEDLDEVIAEQKSLLDELSAILDEKAGGESAREYLIKDLVLYENDTGAGIFSPAPTEGVTYYASVDGVEVGSAVYGEDYEGYLTFPEYNGNVLVYVSSDGWVVTGEDWEMTTTHTCSVWTKKSATGGGSGYHYYFDDADECWYDASDLGWSDNAYFSTGYCPNCGCKLSELNYVGELDTNCPHCGAEITYYQGNVNLR